MVDLTADTEEEDMGEAPATPPPNVSDSDMETDEEADLLASNGAASKRRRRLSTRLKRQSASASTGQ